jgi:hypothetical protein
MSDTVNLVIIAPGFAEVPPPHHRRYLDAQLLSILMHARGEAEHVRTWVYECYYLARTLRLLSSREATPWLLHMGVGICLDGTLAEAKRAEGKSVAYIVGGSSGVQGNHWQSSHAVSFDSAEARAVRAAKFDEFRWAVGHLKP